VKVLVTGAEGFVGGHLVPALVGAGHDVVALVRDRSRAPSGPTVLEANLTRPVDRALVGEVAAIVHLAQANVPFPDGARDLFLVNTASTQDLLDLARCRGARFVHASSGSVYGLGDEQVSEDAPLRATDFYSATKRSAELLVRSYAGELPGAVSLRLFTPYGPGQRGRLVPALIERVLSGKAVTLSGAAGRPRLTPTFVDDVGRAFVAALDLDGHHVVNVAGDEPVSIRGLAERIGEVLDREPVFEERDDTSGGDLLGANDRMKRVLGVDGLVPLSDGLRATVLEEARV
jgi:nucleoside-diphosphate-sugar epimerase